MHIRADCRSDEAEILKMQPVILRPALPMGLLLPMCFKTEKFTMTG